MVDNTGGGDTPSSDSTSDSTDSTSSDSTDSTSSDSTDSTSSDSTDTSDSTDSSNAQDVSSAGITLTSGSSTSGGESGTTAGSVAMYEVVKKNVGQPPTPQSEISFGYILFIVGLLLIFFFGFTRPNNRA